MSRPHYLCKKVQPGEIKPMTADTIRMMAQAEDLVAYGIRRGLLAYPRGTEFDREGRVIPKIATDSEPIRSIKSYPCIRAYLMHDNGSTYAEIAKAIHAGTAKVAEIIAHGREIYRRQAVEIAKEGEDATQQSKRASGAGNAQGGPSKAETPPGWEPSQPKPSTQGPKQSDDPPSVNKS
jgi:hypothetical protein